MSETILKILLTELTLIRVVCKGHRSDGVPCGAVFELSLDRIAGTFQNGQLAEWVCPFCKTAFHLHDRLGNHLDPFAPLAKAVADLAAMGKSLEVQFVIPAKDR
jgi:hypothetical protein